MPKIDALRSLSLFAFSWNNSCILIKLVSISGQFSFIGKVSNSISSFKNGTTSYAPGALSCLSIDFAT